MVKTGKMQVYFNQVSFLRCPHLKIITYCMSASKIHLYLLLQKSLPHDMMYHTKLSEYVEETFASVL